MRTFVRCEAVNKAMGAEVAESLIVKLHYFLRIEVAATHTATIHGYAFQTVRNANAMSAIQKSLVV
jgi:hypothetical protein